MKFTDSLIDYIHSRNFNLQDLTIIVPNERAVKYISASLYNRYQKPLFSPKIYTIDKWIRSLCPLTIIEKTRLLIELYKIQETNPIEEGDLSFDQFILWGQTLLQDFDEIDRYLSDHKEVFQNLRDIRELESWNMEPEQWSLTQQKFMAFWEKLPDYYVRLNNVLSSKKSTYSGGAYRWVAENLPLVEFSHTENFIFAGFNALSKTEIAIMKYMKDYKNASIFIDADIYYLNESMHEAGMFIRQFIHELGVRELPFTQNAMLQSSKEINIIDCAQYTGQVKLAATELSGLNSEELDETLVLLADEGLIVPMLRNIPKSVQRANITLGLPLKNTPAKTWLDLLFKIQENKKRFGESVIYFNDLQQFMNHPFIQVGASVEEQTQMSELEQISKKFNRIVQKIENLPLSNRLIAVLNKICLNWENNWLNAIQVVREINQLVYKSIPTSSLFERAVIQNFDSSLIEIENIALEGFPSMNLKSFALLFKNHAFSKSIAYHGNPIQGLQIMGLLETRLLDFERIIILGMNEGNLPPVNAIQTFIPMDLRRYLGLPLPRDKQGLFAHHFYRLLHHARNITITYSTSGEKIGGSEPSRYLLQLEMELLRQNPKIKLTKRHYHIPEEVSAGLKSEIVKDKFYFDRLDQFFKRPLSASAINKYLTCPMDFYYRYILEFGEEQDLEEEVESNTFGLFIHAVLEELFLPFAFTDKEGKQRMPEKRIIKENDIVEMLGKYEILMHQQFMAHFGNNEKAFKTGNNLLSYKMSLELTRKILEKELQEIKDLGVCRYIYQLEGFLKSEVEIEIHGEKRLIQLIGFVDRIDGVGDRMRVIDYKSGNVKDYHVKFSLTKDRDVKKSFTQTKFALQLALYCLMFQKKYGYLPEEASIYSLVNVNDGLFSLYSDKLSIQEIVNLVPQLLEQIIQEMYDPEVMIEHDSDAKYCQFC
jgi:RecB family exonuclease